jgi:hypothetical protein
MIWIEELKRPFPPEDIEWRIQRSGMKEGKPWAMVLAYVTNRAIQDRLDIVIGPENWRNIYKPGPAGGVLCGIAIRLEGRGWITKWDGAENTDIESIKGGLSGAMKRAAVQWGIGRYLYNLEAGFANFHDNGKHRDYIKVSRNSNDGAWFRWDPPPLPEWALPAGVQPTTEPPGDNGHHPSIGEAKNKTLEYLESKCDVLAPGDVAGFKEAIVKEKSIDGVREIRDAIVKKVRDEEMLTNV